jgi:hypothetical protein
MNNLSTQTEQTMSSLEIAKLTEKEHKNVLADIRKVLDEVGINPAVFAAVYKDQQLIDRPCFNLPQDLANLLLEKYKGLARVPHRLREESALKTIEQLLRVTLIRQFKVSSYRIDGYDPVANIAYEIDEPEHKYARAHDDRREKAIIRLLGCRFVRIQL